MRRSALLLLLALPATAQETEQRVAREVAEAHAKGDRGRLVLLAAEPALRVDYPRVVDILLRQGRGDAAEALASERQGPEAEGLVRLVQGFRKGIRPTDAAREEFRQAAGLLSKEPEAALRILDALRPPEGTLFAADVSWARARALLLLDRRDDARAELGRCAKAARAVGEWAMVRDAEEARMKLAPLAEALEPAEAFLGAAKLLDDHAATIRALRARAQIRTADGRRLREAGKLDEARLRRRDARDDYLTAADLAEKDGDRLQQGLCWRDLAILWHADERQPGEALKIYDRAIQLLQGAGSPEELDGTIFNSALVLTDLGRYDDALERLEQILAPGRSAAVRAKALMQKAYVLVRTGRFRSALPAYAEALAAAPEADRVPLLIAMGELHLARRDAASALLAFGEAEKLAPDASAAWSGRAHALGLRGDDAEAREALRGALERERDPVLRARMRLVAAQLRSFCDVDEAAKLAWEALKTFTDVDLGEFGNAGAAWHTVAELTMLQGDQEKAAEHLAKAATLFYKLNDPTRAIGLYAEWMLLLVMLRQPDAIERLQVLMKMAETTPDDALKSVANSAAAIYEARGGRGGRATEFLDEAEKLARSAGDRTREATALVNRALLDPEGAAGHVRRALGLLDAERLAGPEERPLVEGYSPDWGPGIALDGILQSEKESPDDAFALMERALGRLLLLGFKGRDAVLLVGLSAEQHGAYVVARADLIEARATGKGVAEAEAAFDAMVGRLRQEAPAIADLAWPPEPPLVEVQRALRADEALVMTLFDPYVKCVLVVSKGGAALRRVEKPETVLKEVADLLKGHRTVIACGAPLPLATSEVPTAGVFLRLRAAKRLRGEGVAALGATHVRFGAPVERLPDRRLAMVYVDGIDLAPLRLLARRFDADTVVVASPGALPLPAAALLAAGAGNVVVGERPPGPLDIFLDGWFDRKLPVAAAFREASAKGALFLYGAPD